MAHELSSPDQWLLLHGDALYRYSLSRVGNSATAEDLVQDTLLAALKARQKFSGQATEKTWLTGILKHKIVDHFRKVSREQTRVFDDCLNNDEDYFDQQGHWKIDLSSWSKPDQSMQQEQFMATLQACIERLPSSMAHIFILREFDNMQSQEICELLAISSLNNLWVILSRARLQLRHCLDINWLNQ
jgi:RNA polymerase sigma-70 factor (ECF subfamily)